MGRRRKKRVVLAIVNADTESTVEGYMSAFIAKVCHTRLEVAYSKWKGFTVGRQPTKSYLRKAAKIDSIIASIPERFVTTQQEAVKAYFDSLHQINNDIRPLLREISKNGAQDLEPVIVVHFANLSWDLDVLRGIIFTGEHDYYNVGPETDLIEFNCDGIHFRDFLRVTGFRSIRMAGMVCTRVKKLQGQEVYDLKIKDVPEDYNDYSQSVRDYIEADVDVMNESLNIMINRKENLVIKTLNDLPMTQTSFGRFRFMNSPEIVGSGDEKTNVPFLLTAARWRYARPYVPFLMASFKGGYCGPNPSIQYQVLKDAICWDAVSMYPHKMLFFKMMQCNQYTRCLFTERSLKEIAEDPCPSEVEGKILWRYNNVVEYFNNCIDSEGFFKVRPDEKGIGISPWIGTVTLRIHSLRCNPETNIYMPPVLSSHKIMGPIQEVGVKTILGKNVEKCNGKILCCEEIDILLSSIDLLLVFMCYECEVIKITDVLVMGWRDMLSVQKRDVLEAYKRKMYISEVLKNPDQRFENDDYWKNICGFSPESINAMGIDEYLSFCKSYKMMVKADVNGKFGMTVEKPVHIKTGVGNFMETNLPDVVEEETRDQLALRILDHPEDIPNSVKTSDFCAGCSITMWARWQLISMAYILFRHGSEIYYSDTDSLFCKDTQENADLFYRFNDLMNAAYHDGFIDQSLTIHPEDFENIGTFEIDKRCTFFRTLGSKNYCYVDKKGKFHVTVAGLRNNSMEKFLEEISAEIGPYQTMSAFYRPSTFIHPDVNKKLLKDRTNMGYDEQGKWIGPVLVPCGFALCNMDSRYHMNNAFMAELMQGKSHGYYIGKFMDKLFLTPEGFNKGGLENVVVEQIEPKEDNVPVDKRGGISWRKVLNQN